MPMAIAEAQIMQCYSCIAAVMLTVRCSATEELQELGRREKEQGIEPDPEIDAFMKANAIEGKRESIETEYVLHILGLAICADTLVSSNPGPPSFQGSKIPFTIRETAPSTKDLTRRWRQRWSVVPGTCPPDGRPSSAV